MKMPRAGEGKATSASSASASEASGKASSSSASMPRSSQAKPATAPVWKTLPASEEDDDWEDESEGGDERAPVGEEEEVDFAFFLASIGELDDEDDELDDTEPESTAVTAVDIDELLEVMRMDDDDDREEQEEPEEPALVLLGQDVRPPPPACRLTSTSALPLERQLDKKRGRPLRQDEDYSDGEITQGVLEIQQIVARIAEERMTSLPADTVTTLRARFRKAVKKIRSRTANTNNKYQRIMSKVPVECQFAIFLAASEIDELPLYASPTPPTATTLRARALSTPAWNDASWLSYTLLLFRAGALRPAGYEGAAAATSWTGRGGGAARGAKHLSALRNGKQALVYETLRAFPGDLAFYLSFRLDVSDLKERSALLQAARCVTQHISECVRHELYTSFHPKSQHYADAAGAEWWGTGPYLGLNTQTPARQGFRALSSLTAAQRRARARQGAGGRWTTALGQAWRRARSSAPAAAEARHRHYGTAVYWETLRRWRASNKALVRSYEARCRAKYKANLKAAKASLASGKKEADLSEPQQRAVARRAAETSRETARAVDRKAARHQLKAAEKRGVSDSELTPAEAKAKKLREQGKQKRAHQDRVVAEAEAALAAGIPLTDTQQKELERRETRKRNNRERNRRTRAKGKK